ncbi:MAG: InlB B-repeat-containing protein [Paludibacteraceae bacterium]|nr:InlB B-repeat-containing protein [Paludibacteraceae bacterium]
MKTLYTTYNNFAKRLVMSLMVLMTVGVGTVLGAQETLSGSFTSSNTTSGGFTASGGSAGSYYKLQTGYIISDASYSVDATKSISVSMKVGTYGTYSANKQSVDFYAVDKNGNIISNKVTASFSNANSSGTNFSGTITLNSGNSGNDVRFKFASNSNATSSVCARFYNFTITYESAPSTFTVTYDDNGATSGTVPTDDNEYERGTAVTVLDNTGNLVKTGYRFDGWQIDKAGIVYNAGDKFNISANTTLYAQWTARTLTNYRTSCSTETVVSLDPNGGTFATDPEGWTKDGNNYVITHTGTEITLPINISQEGKIFEGWYDDSDNEWKSIPADLTESITLTAKWSDKQDPKIAWNPTTCTVTIDAIEELPGFQNPNNLTPITFESSNSEVASVDNNGVITLGTTATKATVIITATFDGDVTYAAKNVTCTLTVNPSNCRWVEVTDNNTLKDGDEVVITMTKYGSDGLPYTYALPNAKRVTSNPAPSAIDVTTNIVGNEMTFVANNIANNIKWTIERVDDYYVFYTISNEGRYNLYCNSSDNGVCVAGSGNALTNHKFSIEGNYLKSQAELRYLAISFNTTPYSWRSILDNTNSTYSGQTLKFYKRECLDATNYWVTWDANGGQWTDGSTKKLKSYEVGATITKPENPSREGYRFDGWTPAPTTMPAENITFTAKWTEVYTITWYENGVPSYTYVPSDNAVVTWEDNIADCGKKKFYGWTADDTFVSDPTTPPTLISKGTTIAGDVTYYAVYADAVKPANPGYTKVTTISEGTYLIATGETSSNKAYTGKYSDKTYGGTCDVTVNNQVISTKPTSAVEVEVTLGTGANSGKFAICDGTYYLSAPNDNALTFNGNIVYDWKLTADGYINSTGQSTRYIQLNSSANPNRFACYTGTQKYAYLYKKQTTTYKNFAVSCATYDILVTTSTGGTVTTTPADEAGAGQEITINVTPDDCKYLTGLKYNYDSDHSDYSIDIYSTPYKFTMPAANVTVTATFADKTATDIEILTSAHRMLMQGSAFVGEQVRITYNNGDTETLNWNDSRLTFSGHNTATLGSQTVTVTYNDCGTQSASYNIEVIDGLGITFWDGDYTETIKYEPGDLVDVDNKIGQSICDGWKFVGWSETKVANESNGFSPVHNFNATEPRTLYAVYVQTSIDWISAYNIEELHPGAKYVIVAHYSDSKEYALTNTNNTSNSYLDGANLMTDCEKIREGDAYPYKDRYKLKVTPDENWKWQLEQVGTGWYMRNIEANKYLKINSDKTISLTTATEDLFTLSNGDKDSEITALSSSNNYLSWYNSSKYWNGHTSGKQYYLTNETNFTSTPPCSPLSATFYGNGGIVTDGIKSGDYLPIKEPTRDAGIITPTASFADCNGKSWTFVGWSREEIDVTRVPVLTTDLLHDGGGNKHYYIQEDGEEFWAVFTNIGNPETKYGTITFTQNDWGPSYTDGTKTKTVNSIDYTFDYKRLSSASTQGIQFEESTGTFANATSLGKINSISFVNFNRGDINDLKVYVGKTANNVTTVLTAADLQIVGNTCTYYPSADYAYFKVVSVGDVCYVEEIIINYGQGTQVWATTPDCSIIRILTDEEVYVTATKDRGVMATASLTIKTWQLDPNADVIITSTSNDVYFSASREANFAKAVANQPKNSLTLNADEEGNLQQDIYVHYKPSVEGDGTPASVVVSANLATPNPSITDDQTIFVRNLPDQFVIATKVGSHWYALPADMSSATNPEGVLIEVDEATMTATATNTTSYTLFPVKTTNGEYDRYATNTAHYEGNAYGDRVRFVAALDNKGLWANNNENGNTIRNYAAISSISDGGTTSNTNPSYEWKITTTVVDGNWQYTLQTDQEKNQKYLRYWTGATGSPKWGTYAAGNDQLYFLPVTTYTEMDIEVMEWGTNSMVWRIEQNAPSKVNIKYNSITRGELPVNQIENSDLYIVEYNLQGNDCGIMTIDDGLGARKIIRTPILVSGEKKGSDYTTSPGRDICADCDIVILNGGKLTADELKSTGSHVDFANIYVYPGGKLVLDGKSLGVKQQVYLRGGYSWLNQTTYALPEVYLNGDINFNGSGNMIYDYYIRNHKYYQFALPYDVQLAKVTDESGADNFPVWVKHYNGALRAADANATSWEWYPSESGDANAYFYAGEGYIIAAKPRQVGNTANRPLSIIRFPLGNTALSGAESDKSIATKAHGIDGYYAGTVTANNVGWNFIANPFLSTWKGDIGHKQLTQHLEDGKWDGTYDWVDANTKYITIMSPEDGTDYAQYVASTTELQPFFPFYLQETANGGSGEINFVAANRVKKAPAKILAEVMREAFVQIEIVDGDNIDQTGLYVSDKYSDDIDFDDLEKMFGTATDKAKAWFVHDNKRMAFEAITENRATGSVPLGYRAPQEGSYTFTINEGISKMDCVENIYLTDYENSVMDYDLLLSDYNFESQSVLYNDTRFTVRIIMKEKGEGTVTGVDYIGVQDELPIKFIYQDKIFILHNETIYDATGKKVTTINK